MNKKIIKLLVILLVIVIAVIFIKVKGQTSQPAENKEATVNIELKEKCSTSAEPAKHFWANVCLDLPEGWVHRPLGYEDQIVFVPYERSSDGTSATIMRKDESLAKDLDDFVKDQIDSLIHEYHGKALTKKSLDTDKYYLEVTFYYSSFKAHTYTYFYHDKKHHYYWQIIFLVPESKHKEYDDIAPTIVTQLNIPLMV